MLAQIEPARNDFHVLARYLLHGKDCPTHPERVAWMFGHNLPDDDPMLAATLMAATAELSKRCRTACYHMSINWHPDEQPTPEIMQEIARKTLILAGLAEHQALVMGHGDKPHNHLHIMLNRVHPETGLAWSTAHDYRRFDAIMKQLSEDYGFQHVPPHCFHPDATHELPKRPNSNATYAARRGARTGRPQWSRAHAHLYASRISELLEQSSSTADLEALFAEDGLTLEPKGKGWVVGNTTSYVKLSALGLMRTAHGLAKRRPSPPKRRRRKHRFRSRSLLTVDAVDIARAIGTKDELRTALHAAAAQRQARIARKPLMDRLMEELKQKLKATTILSPLRRRPTTQKRPTPTTRPKHSR